MLRFFSVSEFLSQRMASIALSLGLLGVSGSALAQDNPGCKGQTLQNVQGEPTYGTLAADFTVQTSQGPFHLRDHWTSCDVYVVLKTFSVQAGSPLQGLSAAANHLWSQRLDYLLQVSPRNAHYFFVSQNSDANQRASDQALIEGHIKDALAPLPAAEQAFWKERLHVVNEDIMSGNAAWVGRLGLDSFVIDRFQKVRAFGQGIFAPLLNDGDLIKLAPEVSFANFQWDREQALKNRSDKIVPAFNEGVEAGWDSFGGTIKEVEFPNADEMASYDGLLIDLELTCADNGGACVYKDGNYYYDRVIEAYLCQDEVDTQCDLEIGRWITPFGTGGRWVHDISPLLALVKKGGKHRVRFHTVDRYNVNLKFRLSRSTLNQKSQPKPFAYQELFRGGKFDSALNARDPMSFMVPPGTTRVAVVSTTTGHGWGKNADNCAEFCTSQHEWTLNGQAQDVITLDGPVDQLSCFFGSDRGVIPNQPGTWYFGRSGWCPGLEVQPRVWDITAQVDPIGPNQLRYRALFNGADFTPTPLPGGNANGYDPEINLRSYVVFYK